MNLKRTLKALDALANPDTVQLWSAMGMDVSKYKGADLNDIRQLAKEIGRDHIFALALWNAGTHEARLLSVFVEEHEKVKKAQLEKQIRQITFWDLSDRYCETLVARSAKSAQIVEKWINDEQDLVRRSAYITTGHLARKYKSIPDEFFFSVLDSLVNNAHQEANWVKDGMMQSLMNIGMRNRSVNEYAIEVCEAIGAVEVTFGKNTTQVPAPLSVLTAERIQEKLY